MSLPLPFPVPRPVASFADVLDLPPTPWAWHPWRWLDDHVRELVRILERRPLFRDGARAFDRGEIVYACRMMGQLEAVRTRVWLRTWARTVGPTRSAELRGALDLTSDDAERLFVVAIGKGLDEVELFRVLPSIARRAP